MSNYQLPPLTDPSWLGISRYVADLATNAPSPWREHFAAELAVMQPTLRALGIDTSLPPPLQNQQDPLPPGRAAPPGSGMIHVFSTAPQAGPLSDADGRQLAIEVARQLQKDFGFTPAQAAGIVGNLFHESAGMNANVNEFGWRYAAGDSRNYGRPFDNPYGYGWAQWTGDRKDAYLSFCKGNGLDPASPAANYAFLVHELKTTEAGAVRAISATGSPEESAVVFRQVFERAAMPVDGKRTAAASEIYSFLA